jgi:hypothetical protein
MTAVGRASLIATLSLLASAATAHAECAWVLSEISSPSSTQREWSFDKVDAEPTNAACRQRAEVAIRRRMEQGKLRGWTIIRGEANRLEFLKTNPKDYFFTDFQCWPDTVDLLASKEK